MKRTKLKRKGKLRKKTKLTAEVLRKRAVTLAKQIVRKQHNYTCEYCGKKEPQVKTHGSHIYSEGIYRAMSADLDNILCLCFTHHLGGWNANEPSWHKNPIEMVNWFNKKYPKRAAELKKRTQRSIQADLYFWEQKLKELKERYDCAKL